MMLSRFSDEAFMLLSSFSCEGSTLDSSNNLTIPMMAFNGVLISWLIFARKRVLASLADWAAVVAFFSSWSARIRLVISLAIPMVPSNRPPGSTTGAR